MVMGSVIWIDRLMLMLAHGQGRSDLGRQRLGSLIDQVECRDYKSVDNPQIGLSSVVVGEMTDICEAAPGAVSPCGGENMIDWIDLW